MDVTLAVMSDLHCHPSTMMPWDSFLHSDSLRLPTNRHPISGLLELIKRERLKARILLVPGDITNRVDKQGLASGWNFATEVGRALKCSKTAATPGNHDVDSQRVHGNADCFDITRNFHDSYPVAGNKARRDFWADSFYLLEIGNTRLLILNGVTQHADAREAKRGKISESVLKALEERLATTAKTQSFQIALLHHHPIQHEDLGLGAEDLLENGSRLVDILDDHDFDLIIHGHKHHPKLSYAPGGATTVPVFAAGSFSATNSKGLTTVTRNLFHLITLRKDSSSAGCLGRIQSWEWHLGEGWITPNFTSAHFPAVTGFGYRGSVDDLADKLTGWFRSTGSETKHWSEAVSAFPEIEDLIPRDFRSLGERLSNTHKLTLAPSPPDQPTFIGRVK